MEKVTEYNKYSYSKKCIMIDRVFEKYDLGYIEDNALIDCFNYASLMENSQ